MGCLTHCINSKDPVSAAMTKGLKKREALPPWLNGRIVGRSCEVEGREPSGPVGFRNGLDKAAKCNDASERLGDGIVNNKFRAQDT